jgi:hypothetical protein
MTRLVRFASVLFALVTAVVAEPIAIFDELPGFDYGSYTSAAARRECGGCRRSFALEMELCPYDGSELRVEAEGRP